MKLYKCNNVSCSIIFILIPEQASKGKNITPVCTTLSVCISIEQSRGSPESQEWLVIDIQNQRPGGRKAMNRRFN